jgi:hypothetical protein
MVQQTCLKILRDENGIRPNETNLRNDDRSQNEIAHPRTIQRSTDI